MKLSSHASGILFSGGTASEANRISREVKAGRLRRLLRGVYSSDLTTDPAELVRGNWRQVLAYTYPGALLTHPSALEYEPSPAGILYVTHSQDRVVKWPGLVVKLRKGPTAGKDDRELFTGLHVSSEERALLENLMPARASGGERRTLDQEHVEARLLKHLDIRGEEELKCMRDKARKRAKELSMQSAFAKLDNIIGALLATRSAGLVSKAAKAHAAGEPYDAGRVQLFDRLANALRREVLPIRLERTGTEAKFRDFAFFESYFSNYIEGTEFEVKEAADIVYRGAKLPNRTGDSHDILGTFEVCGDRREMTRTVDDGIEFVELLRARHRVLLRGRPEKEPGILKERANRAGNTPFVEPRLVRGTLKAGFERLATLDEPLARALYMMFIVSEVHPFNDGNGRIARVMMNAELVIGKRTKLIIPTVFREDYLLALRKLSRQQQTEAFIRMMDRAHAWSHWLEPVSYAHLHSQMLQSNSYQEPEVARLQWPT